MDKITRLEELYGECFPHMIQHLKKGNIWAWDNKGLTKTLTDEQRETIKEVEDKYTATVYAVLDNHIVMGSEVVHMESYLFLTDLDKEASLDIMPGAPGHFYAISEVLNKSWDIREAGSVVIRRSLSGGPVRVG